MDAKTSEETRNEQVIRSLYSLAEAKSKDTPKFVSLFTNDGYFYDVAAGKKYYGRDIGVTVDVYATAFPDMHRELYDLHTIGDLVLVELSLNGTHKGDLVLPPGTIPPTGKTMHAPCCDVFHLKDGKVRSFHCYVAVPILLEQLHAAHLAELDDGGKLVMAGPLPERSGGLIVLRTGSVAEAKAIADEDPLVRGVDNRH